MILLSILLLLTLVEMSSSPVVGSSEKLEDNIFGLNYVILGIGTGCLVVVAIVAAVVLRCYASLDWTRYQRQKDEEDPTKTNIRISHSLPDLTQDISKHEYIQEVKEKKVY